MGLFVFQGVPDVRLAYIQFVLSFLIAGDDSTIGQVLELKGRCFLCPLGKPTCRGSEEVAASHFFQKSAAFAATRYSGMGAHLWAMPS